MGQSKAWSMVEACLNTASGFVVSMLIWTLVAVPLWHLPVTMGDNLAINMLFTVASVVRSYIWRRIFNAKHNKDNFSTCSQPSTSSTST